MIETKEDVGGIKIEENEIFNFACKPELACFNTCCRFKRLPLWPYDVLRLRRALDLPSYAVLEKYAELEFDPKSGWPALRLKLDEEGKCPFVSEDGCRVYNHRPAACRVYPLARAVRRGRLDEPLEVVYLRQETENCLGWDQDVSHTTESWTEDQELAEYDQATDRMTDLFFHPKRKGKMELTPQQTHAVIAALYNIDIFRRMITTPEVRRLFEPGDIDAALESDESLLFLGKEFLMKTLFG